LAEKSTAEKEQKPHEIHRHLSAPGRVRRRRRGDIMAARPGRPSPPPGRMAKQPTGLKGKNMNRNEIRELLGENWQEIVISRIIDGIKNENLDIEVCDDIKARLINTAKDSIQRQVGVAMEQIIGPSVAKMIEEINFTETNAYGEPKGERKTFLAYAIETANNYLRDQVNFNGESKRECKDQYGWRPYTTRASYMIHKHLQTDIEKAMKSAINNISSSISGGLQGAFQTAINDIASKITFTIKP
jgi:hypothetical protein